MPFRVSLNKKRQNQNPSLCPVPHQSPAIYLQGRIELWRKKKGIEKRKDIFKRTSLFLFLCSLILFNFSHLCLSFHYLVHMQRAVVPPGGLRYNRRLFALQPIQSGPENLVTTSLYLATSSSFVIPRLSSSVDCKTSLAILENAQTIFVTKLRRCLHRGARSVEGCLVRIRTGVAQGSALWRIFLWKNTSPGAKNCETSFCTHVIITRKNKNLYIYITSFELTAN